MVKGSAHGAVRHERNPVKFGICTLKHIVQFSEDEKKIYLYTQIYIYMYEDDGNSYDAVESTKSG